MAKTLAIGALLAYFITFGGRWRGILDVTAVSISLTLIAVVVLIWIGVRTGQRWRWHATALDRLLPVWLAAFGISTLLNLDNLVFVAAGLWFMGLYILIWYVLQDMLANQFITSQMLTAGLLIGGSLVIGSGLYEVLSGQRWSIAADRAAGLLVNPNVLGSFLVPALPLATGYAMRRSVNWRWQAMWVPYIALSAVVLLFTFSRGAWFGVCVAVGVALSHYYPRYRLAILIALGLIALGLYNIRGDQGRLTIYRDALRKTETTLTSLLTGSGLFTYRMLYRDEGDLRQIVIHAHNSVIHVGAELGIPGVIALSTTTIVFARRLWLQRIPEQLPLISALSGLAVHQVLDFTVMVPGIALTGLLVLCAALRPDVEIDKHLRWPVWGCAILALILIITGALNPGLIDWLIALKFK